MKRETTLFDKKTQHLYREEMAKVDIIPEKQDRLFDTTGCKDFSEVCSCMRMWACTGKTVNKPMEQNRESRTKLGHLQNLIFNTMGIEKQQREENIY